ncbi:MFS transporter [Yunchengibacter salinarum]|uniref:MFS transporter n=1 Tax=Yunchengibacter salinarum TaxID=3133399 RepID=UPI0035B5BF26
MTTTSQSQSQQAGWGEGTRPVNVLFLALAQAGFLCSSMAGVAYAGLAGAMLASDAALATVPVFVINSFNAIATVPLSLLMARTSRRTGYFLGAGSGVLGALIVALAIRQGSFGLMLVGAAGMGVFHAAGQYFRYGAAESVGAHQRARAISLVLVGGILAALIVPGLSEAFNAAFLPYSFMGVFLFVALAAALTFVPLAFYRPVDPAHTAPPVAEGGTEDRRDRPLSRIVVTPGFLVAVLNAGLGYAMMSFMMTATPLAMAGCGFGSGQSTQVIQGHVLAMFIPSLFTGGLIARLGVKPVLLLGHGLFALSLLAALDGVALANFSVSLILLGVAWNFTFVGGTSLLTRVHGPKETGRVQGAGELVVFTLSATGSFASGVVLRYFGWESVAGASFALLAVVALVTIIYVMSGARPAPRTVP